MRSRSCHRYAAMADAIERLCRALLKPHPQRPNRRRTAIALARRIGIDPRLRDFQRGLRRGHCARKRCASVFAIRRVTIDFRDPARLDTSCVLECAECGRTWTRAPVPDLRLRNGRQPEVLLTLIEPPNRGEKHRTYVTARGARRSTGTDCRITRNATYSHMEAASDDWRARNSALVDRKERARARRQERSEQTMREYRAACKRLEERNP